MKTIVGSALVRVLTAALCLGIGFAQAAEVYRRVDEHGNIIYSDQPSDDAEKIHVDDPQTISPPPPEKPFSYTPPPADPAPPYSRLEIVSPADGESVRLDEGALSLSVALDPSLRPGDTLVLLIDGQEKATTSNSTTFSLDDLERGTHQATVSVRGPNGKTRQTSASISFTLHLPSVLHPTPTVGKPPAKKG